MSPLNEQQIPMYKISKPSF